MRRAVAGGAFLLAVLTAGGAAQAAGPTFTVRYRSAANVYLDSGKAQGLSVGDRLSVAAGADVVGELEVVFLAEQSASCRVVSEKRAVRAGDLVTILKHSEPAPSAAASPAPGSPAAPKIADTAVPQTGLAVSKASKPAKPFARVRGGVSLGLYKVWASSGSGTGFEQRTGRLDLSLYDIGGNPLSFNTRFRSRQDVRLLSLSQRTTLNERKDRLYDLTLRYEPPSDNFTFEVGRLGSSRFTGYGYLDGGLVRVRLGSPLQIGTFFGRSADVEGFGPDASGPKYGAFLRLSPRSPTGAYDAVVSVVREFAKVDVSREYLSVEGRFGSGAVTLFERAEVDLNRGWRRELASQDYQISNISVSTNFRFSPSASAVLSYDSRRNYRDYLTRDVPERIFDDLLHQGFRGNVFLGRGSGFNVSGGFGVRLKEQDATTNAYSWNGGLRHGNVFAKDISLGADLSGFQNGLTQGYLLTAQAGKRFRKGHQLDFSYGRSLYEVIAVNQRRRTEYFRFTGRGDFGRHFYLLTDVEYDRGDDLQGPRGFFEIGYQF